MLIRLFLTVSTIARQTAFGRSWRLLTPLVANGPIALGGPRRLSPVMPRATTTSEPNFYRTFAPSSWMRATPERLGSTIIVERLAAMDGRPWAECSRGRPITTNKLATMLRNYGIRSLVVRIGKKTLHAYSRTAFEDSWTRYGDFGSQHRNIVNNDGAETAFSDRNTEGECCDPTSATNPMNTDACCDVAIGEGKAMLATTARCPAMAFSESADVVILRGGLVTTAAALKLLWALEHEHFTIRLLDGRLQVLPVERLTPALAYQIRDHRDELIELVRYQRDDSHLFSDGISSHGRTV